MNGDVIDYLEASTANFFGAHWGADAPEGRLRKAWSGVMGFSGDGFPLIGPMPADDGLYVAAAFQGHGMVNCFLCAKALAQMLAGRESETLGDWLPRPYRTSESRLAVKLLHRLNTKGNGRSHEM